MGTGLPLRLYANPARLFFYLVVLGGFTLGGLWMLRDSGGVSLFVVGGWIFIVFFGFAAAIFLIQVVRAVILRLPVLQIDEQGWTSRPTLLVGNRTAKWEDIEYVGIYRQWLGRSGIWRNTRYTYYLVVRGREPGKVSRISLDSFAVRFFPLLREAVMAVPLNSLFVRTTPEKVEELLRCILTSCAHEILVYGVQASAEVQDL